MTESNNDNQRAKDEMAIKSGRKEERKKKYLFDRKNYNSH